MDDALAAGSRVGRYEIVRRLAIGGMAEIYLARMTGLAGFAKHVVVKRILPSFAKDAEFVRMFLNEARYAATLDHPNISHVYDFGQEGGLYYYAMEYLHGDDCRALLRELAQQRRKMPLAHALTIVVGAATGCHFAHELVGDDGKPLGLVHRDVSPSNVVITYAGAIKLVDFGIAKATQREDATAAGVTKGKLAYMAPEQCRAEPLDRRVDVYALGVLLYELTTQRRAFTGDNDAAIIWAVMSGNVTWPSQLDPDYPPALEEIIKKAMHFERAQRYVTARELAEAIEGFARDAGLTLAPTRLAEFFTEVVGARPEPWRDGEGRAATATPTPSATLMPPTVSTDVPTSVLVAPVRGPAPPVPLPEAAVASTPPAAPRSRAPWLIAGATVVLAGGAVALVLARGQHASEAAPVAVVTERGSVAVEGGDAGAASPPPLDAPPVATIDAGPRLDAGPRAGSTSRPPPPPPHGDPLSSAFARRQGAVESCLERHRDAATTAPAITLRFEIDAAGAPTRVDVLPAAVAATPLGACIAAVGRSTKFPPQGGATTFRINLQVSQHPGTP